MPPGEQEERGGDEPVVDHLQQAAVDTRIVDGEEADDDEAHLREARVGDDAAEVRRAEREEGAVHETDRRQGEHDVSPVRDRLGEVRDDDAQKAVRRGLRDDAGEERRDLGRRLPIGVRQPAVEREDRRLDREGDGEAQEDPSARARSHRVQVEGALVEPEGDDGDEHEQRARQRVDHELERRRDPTGASPDAHEDVERDHHRFEEDVEEQEVLGGEHADRRRFEEEDEPEVGAGPWPPGPECIARSGEGDDGGQADEPERPVVDADRVRDAELLDPRHGEVVLEPGRPEVEAGDDGDPEPDLGHRRRAGEETGRPRAPRDNPERQGGGEREADEDGRQHVRATSEP
jgi:hypothetical protein